jgi:hypothetical protein
MLLTTGNKYDNVLWGKRTFQLNRKTLFSLKLLHGRTWCNLLSTKPKPKKVARDAKQGSRNT